MATVGNVKLLLNLFIFQQFAAHWWIAFAKIISFQFIEVRNLHTVSGI